MGRSRRVLRIAARSTSMLLQVWEVRTQATPELHVSGERYCGATCASVIGQDKFLAEECYVISDVYGSVPVSNLSNHMWK